MKRYFVVAMGVAIVAVLLCLSLGEKSSAGPPSPSFYGKAVGSRTVTACKLPDFSPCYETRAKGTDTYKFPSDIEYGTYRLEDECQWREATYEGTPTEVNFCVPFPKLIECICW